MVTRTRPKKPIVSARTADRHDLYEQSVQCPAADVAIVDRVFRKEYGRPPRVLREDFCGTAALCAEWVQSRTDRTAVGVDLDPEVLAWGHRRHLQPLGELSKRVRIFQADVRDVPQPKVDVRVAFNFSYFVFKERRDLVDYFRKAHAGLNPQGLFMLDLVGGPDAQVLQEEPREIDGFDYIWDQAEFNPIDHSYVCHIHFAFPDGTEMRKAFTYDWRLWSLMEVRDALAEAGFSRSDVYWEGTNRETGEGNGIYTRRERVPNELAWVVYIVAVP